MVYYDSEIQETQLSLTDHAQHIIKNISDTYHDMP